MIALPLCVAAAAFIVAVGLPSADPDMWWHLASGRWMLDHRELLKVEIFSSTAAGRPYAVGEWLGQIVLAGIHGLAGWQGIAVLRAALVAVAAFALTRVALRMVHLAGGPSSPKMRTAIALTIVGVALALSSVAWTDRPQLVTIALFPVLLDLLFMARAGSRRALYALPVLLFAWSDLHAGYALGLVVVGIFAVEAALARRDAGSFAIAAAISAAVVLLNPGAIGVLPATAHVATAPRIIVEESPPDVLTSAGFVFAAFVVATLAALLIRGGSLLSVLLLVPLLWLALSAQRHMVFFVFASVPFLTEAAVSVMGLVRQGEGASRRGRGEHAISGAGVEGPRPLNDGQHGVAGGEANPRPRRADPRQRRRLTPGVATLLSVAAIASIPLSAPTAPDESIYPRDALPALRASSGVLIHEYDWGGYLIWNVPERPVFVDGRLKPFQPDVIDDHLRATLLRPGWRAVLDHHGVRQALLAPDRPLAGALREEGWRVVAEGSGFVLLERPRG